MNKIKYLIKDIFEPTQRIYGEHETMLRFYGIAYSDPIGYGSVCYPIPINYLIRRIEMGTWTFRSNKFKKKNERSKKAV